MARVLLGDFGAVVRLGLWEVLCSGDQLVAEERQGEGLLDRVVQVLPEVVVLDQDAEGAHELAVGLVTQFPAVKVVACSSRRPAMRIYPPFHGGEFYVAELTRERLLEAVRTSHGPHQQDTQ